MKKVKLLFVTLAVASLGFVSCNDDDNDNVAGNSSSPAEIAGTYNLIAFNTPEETDLNNDGVSHVNLLDESDCYAESKIELRGDNTITYNYRAVSITDGIGGCASAEYNGTWELVSAANNVYTIRVTYLDASGDEQQIAFTKEGATLTQTTLLVGQYPNRNADDDLVYSYGTITRVFQK